MQTQKLPKRGLVSVKLLPGQPPIGQTAKAKSAEKPIVEVDPKYGPMITLNPESKFAFRFGPGKAKLILANISAIQEFAAKFGQQD